VKARASSQTRITLTTPSRTTLRSRARSAEAAGVGAHRLEHRVIEQLPAHSPPPSRGQKSFTRALTFVRMASASRFTLSLKPSFYT
jgi:hypothetical protein